MIKRESHETRRRIYGRYAAVAPPCRKAVKQMVKEGRFDLFDPEPFILGQGGMSSPDVNPFSRRGQRGGRIGVLASLAFFGCSATPDAPCFGLQLNHTYAVTVDEHYDAMSRFTFTTEIASDPAASCGSLLRIPDTTKLTMTVIKQMSEEGCTQSYATVAGIPGVTFVSDFKYDYPAGIGGLQAWANASVGGCLGELRLHINAPRQQPETGDLFRTSQPGLVPEVVMQEVFIPRMQASCMLTLSCSDYYVVIVSP